MPGPASAGALEWGVKAGFRRYVQGLPDGFCDVSTEIDLPGGGRFGFPLTGAEGSPPFLLRFTGTVTFRGHGGLLSVTITEPWLFLRGGAWTLTVRAASGRLPLAVGRPSASSARRVPVALTAEGAALFGGNYPAAEPMDDLVLRLPTESRPPHVA
ncbi:Htaa protein [Actinocorallia herbida]|uniref:Htaa protein n=1 Tax=Actinocorallia herbida TaxID=58109 RepID=A0A3N1D184_9ACTN|nr:HtaA domain-containing protein [Actinocorallia herbida]ROO87271.1 Htaa protein [Actinocorallia herbida]